MNLTDVLTDHTRDRPDHAAIEDGDRIIRYAELEDLVDAAAANLQEAGIAPGDVVAVMLPDSADHLIALLALARIGAVMLAIDDRLPAAETHLTVTTAGARVLIAPDDGKAIAGLRMLPLGQVSRPAAAAFERPALGPDHPLMTVQSSGTTGAPKTFLWTHRQMWVQALRHANSFGWTWRDRYLTVVRLSFVWGREVALVVLCLGGTIVVNRARSLADLVAVSAARRITILALTPAHLAPLLDLDAAHLPLFPSARTMVVGSAPLAHDRRLLARQRLTPNFYEQLGTNEAGLMIVGAPADQDACPAAIGRPADGVKAQVLGEDGEPLPPGEVGLIGYWGDGFPTEYVGNPEATARAFRGGWFYPGDLAAIDADGYVHFKGRADDMISNEGVKFYPIEVEQALLAHPAVAEAAAIGWPHPRHGEVSAAFVVRREPVAAKDLAEFCRQRIAGYKVPHWITFIEAMPRNPAGKILKHRLKALLRDLLDKTAS